MTAGVHHRAWQHLPQGSLDDIVGPGTALILAPHPDDESLGCGGLIAASVVASRPPLVVILTDGAGSHPNSPSFPPTRLREVRANEVRSAMARLGLSQDRLVFLNQPDTMAPHHGPEFDAAVATLAGLIRQQADCTAILAPWRHDPHCDHVAASLLAAAVAAITPVRHVAYPVWGWLLPADSPIPQAPDPGWRLDITPFTVAKQAAVHAHRSQYDNLITDDPDGFRLPAELLSLFDTRFETFLSP